MSPVVQSVLTDLVPRHEAMHIILASWLLHGSLWDAKMIYPRVYTVQPAVSQHRENLERSFIDNTCAVTGGVCHSTPALWGWGLFPIGYFHVRLWYKGLCSIEPYLYYFNKGEDRSLIYWISYSNSPWSIYFTSSLPLVFATNWRLVTGCGSPYVYPA